MEKTIKRPGSVATLTPFLLNEKKSKGTVLVCPGGGYKRISPRESKPVPDALNRRGYDAFVLAYTVEPDMTNPETGDIEPLGTRPLADAAWAMAHIRENAGSYGIDPDKIAVCGFSAGGHLAASLGVYWHLPEFFGGDKPAEAYRPNALILSYAVLSGGVYRHQGSFTSLTGGTVRDRMPFSMEDRISHNTPPTFLWHTAVDASVPVQNSLLFAAKLSKYEIPYEMHIFPYGAHGFSLATAEVCEPGSSRRPDPHVAKWLELCDEWLELTFARE